MNLGSWPAHSVPLRSSYTVTVNLARLDARVVDIIAPANTTNSSDKESDVPSRKQPTCKGCGNKLKAVPVGNGWAHKKREHWTPRPHKAVPVFEEERADVSA